jgi:ribosomal protein S18 acetylase RimI-like enzyme
MAQDGSALRSERYVLVGHDAIERRLQARGRGVARTMCLHSMHEARAEGYRAMQFNLVVSSNESAVRLWQSLGFEIVGRLPEAFQHPRLGYVDAFVLYRSL